MKKKIKRWDMIVNWLEIYKRSTWQCHTFKHDILRLTWGCTSFIRSPHQGRREYPRPPGLYMQSSQSSQITFDITDNFENITGAIIYSLWEVISPLKTPPFAVKSHYPLRKHHLLYKNRKSPLLSGGRVIFISCVHIGYKGITPSSPAPC